MSFSGIPAAALDFYEDLEADNSRTYWMAHRDTYETAVRGPVTALAAALAPEFGEAKVFRPYNDVRFRRDKSPYKTHQGAVVHDGDGSGALYFHVSAAGLFVAAGYHGMAADQLERYRAAVDDDRRGADLEAAVDRVRAAGHGVGGDVLRTRPRGCPPDHPRLEWMRHRTLTAAHDFGAPAWLHTPEAAAAVARTWREMAPLNDWLREHVGASALPRR
ncbi:MAG TPA: DUF2461 domain-containing protein [Jiangellales bacterium]|nr:DUF2461 domain-containing protein [Jiangellales bacterium]